MYDYYSCNSLWPTNKNQPGILQSHAGRVHWLRLKSVGILKPKAEVKSTANCGTISSLASLCDPGVRFSNVPITLWVPKAVFAFKIKVSIILKMIR